MKEAANCVRWLFRVFCVNFLADTIFMIQAFDTDNSGQLDDVEFCRALKKLVRISCFSKSSNPDHNANLECIPFAFRFNHLWKNWSRASIFERSLSADPAVRKVIYYLHTLTGLQSPNPRDQFRLSQHHQQRRTVRQEWHGMCIASSEAVVAIGVDMSNTFSTDDQICFVRFHSTNPS